MSERITWSVAVEHDAFREAVSKSDISADGDEGQIKNHAPVLFSCLLSEFQSDETAVNFLAHLIDEACAWCGTKEVVSALNKNKILKDFFNEHSKTIRAAGRKRKRSRRAQ